MSYRRRRHYYSPPPNRSNNTLPAHAAHYRGIDFKSKTEVRWAVLFDTLSIPWRYEPHQFNTGNGGYIPDFALPSLGVWWEVKGAQPNQAALAAAASVSYWAPICVSWGPLRPGDNGQILAIHNGEYYYAGLAACAICARINVVPLTHNGIHEGHVYQLHHPDITTAFDAATSTTFTSAA